MGESIGPEEDDADASALIDPHIPIIEGCPIDIEDSHEHRQARAGTDISGDEEDEGYWVAAVNDEKGFIDHNTTDTTFVRHGALTLSDQCLMEGHGAPIAPQLNSLIADPTLPIPGKFATDIEWETDRVVYNTAALASQKIDQQILDRLDPS